VDGFPSVVAGLDFGGKSHHTGNMKTAILERPVKIAKPETIDAYDAAADAKNRISLRGATAKYFHVRALSNGSFVLEPRVLVPPECVSERTLKMLGLSVGNFKNGRASAPIDLSDYLKT